MVVIKFLNCRTCWLHHSSLLVCFKYHVKYIYLCVYSFNQAYYNIFKQKRKYLPMKHIKRFYINFFRFIFNYNAIGLFSRKQMHLENTRKIFTFTFQLKSLVYTFLLVTSIQCTSTWSFQF